ncbi:hypothetical protein ACIBFB_04940 [Nocardiopsis sp. NPDC050513]|uniref:hypothetical protein n=1 Tax=Nocardiopsis sp. NPDC050513 TaxID=3364338 RepID=UPI0037B1E23C
MSPRAVRFVRWRLRRHPPEHPHGSDGIWRDAFTRMAPAGMRQAMTDAYALSAVRR